MELNMGGHMTMFIQVHTSCVFIKMNKKLFKIHNHSFFFFFFFLTIIQKHMEKSDWLFLRGTRSDDRFQVGFKKSMSSLQHFITITANLYF